MKEIFSIIGFILMLGFVGAVIGYGVGGNLQTTALGAGAGMFLALCAIGDASKE